MPENQTKMNKLELRPISIESAKEIGQGSYIGNDLVLFDEVGDLPLPDEPRRLDCLLMALCLKGTAEYTVDTVKRTVHPGDIIIISRDQVTEHYKLDHCSGIALLVSHQFFVEIVAGVQELSSLFMFSIGHPVFHLTPRQTENVCLYFNMLKSRVDDTSSHFRRDVARSLLQGLIYEVSSVIWELQSHDEIPQSRAEDIFAQFIKLVESNFRQERRVGWYATALCISPKHLSETIRAVSRRSPAEWIEYYVVMELRVLLRNSNKSIKEITEMMHFPNQSHLGKYFKDHVGMSPSEYRKKIK